MVDMPDILMLPVLGDDTQFARPPAPVPQPPLLRASQREPCLSWAERPAVIAALLTSGIALGAFVGYRVLCDPSAAVVGGITGGTGTMTLHALGRCAVRCARRERDGETDV